MRWSFDLSKSAPQVAQSRCDSAQLQLISYWYLEKDSYILSCKSITPTKGKKNQKLLMIFLLLAHIYQKSQVQSRCKKIFTTPRVFFAKYDFLKGPGGSVSWEVFHPKAHTLRTSSLVKEPRFFNAVDIASFSQEKGRAKKPPGVDPGPDPLSWGFLFFVCWYEITLFLEFL